MQDLTEKEQNEATRRKLWTIDCVLTGAKVFDLLIADKEEEARKKPESLTSEFEPVDIKYLMFRLKKLHP